MLLVLLKMVAWFLVMLIVGAVLSIIAYYCFMYYGGYRWSIHSVRRYLDSHGRGNFPKENRYIIGIDIMTRLIWVAVFTVVLSIVGCILLPNWSLRIGLICAEISFALLMAHVELCFMIRIGRLASIDKEGCTAYFESLDGNSQKVFTYYYGDHDEEGERHLKEGRKYLVADYGIFKMYGAIDDYEWGKSEW